MQEGERRPKRKKTKQACLKCYTSKKYCEGVRPCPRCVKLGIKCEERIATNQKIRSDAATPSSTSKGIAEPFQPTTTSIVINEPIPPIPSSTVTTIQPQTQMQTHSFSFAPSFTQHPSLASFYASAFQHYYPSPHEESIHTTTTTSSQPPVNEAMLDRVLSDITQLQTQLQQKVQLYNAISSDHSLPPLPLPHINSKQARLQLFMTNFAQYTDTCAISVWERATMKLQHFNDNCKMRTSIVVKSTDLVVDSTSFLEAHLLGTDTSGLILELAEPFSAGSEPFVKVAKWRSIFVVDSIPGALMDHTVLYRANEEFFALIEEHPLIFTTPAWSEHRQLPESVISGSSSIDAPGSRNSVTYINVPRGDDIQISDSVYVEFQVNNYKPDVFRNVLFSDMMSSHCEQLQRLKKQ